MKNLAPIYPSPLRLVHTAQANVLIPGLTATGRTITANAGSPFTGIVASFEDAQVPPGSAGDFLATVAWGDGVVTQGAVREVAPGRFEVGGTHTYGTPTSATPLVLGVTIVRASSNQEVSAKGQAIVLVAGLSASGTTITPAVGRPFTGVVATFLDATPGAVASGFAASIDWGDGQTSAGTVVEAGPGRFQVIGSHTYVVAPPAATAPEAPAFQVGVRIARLADGRSLTATTTAAVATDPEIPLGGRLAPTSDSGVSDSDGVTNTNQPTFVGTAEPYSVVKLFAQRSDQSEPFFLGQAVASIAGEWTLTAGPLADGSYRITAEETPAGGSPRPGVVLSPGSQLVIDTVAPRVVDVGYSRSSGRIRVVYQDDRSGFDDANLTTGPFYTLIGPGRARPAFSATVPSPGTPPTAPRGVVLSIAGGARARGRVQALRIRSGGVVDVAGNPLNPLPARAGAFRPAGTLGDFYARFSSRRS